MEDRLKIPLTLGLMTADALEAFAPERTAALERARETFLREPPPRRSLHVPMAAIGIATVLTLIALFVSLRAAPPLNFNVAAHAGRTNEQIAALRAPLRLSFSDGTVLMLDSGTRAHVVDLAPNGAQLALENGSLEANVVHTGASAWSLSAGPFSVRVTGTKFSLSWDPELERFSIRVTEGSVGVSGAVVGAERPVRAGEMLIVSVPEQRLQLSNEEPAAEQPAPTVADLPAPPALARANEPSSTLPVGAPSPSAHGPNPDGWLKLAQQGRLREAYASADAVGFDDTCRSATAADLLLLGDAARLAGRSDRASDALQQLRRRFPNDLRGAAAAFMLGKIAFDRGTGDRSAANWFATSLREQPNGSLAREAAGRLIEALRRAGDGVGAQRAATDYLTRYPNGPHAPLARSLLR